MLKRFWQRIERSFLYYVIRFFRIRGTSDSVARGVAAGVSVHFFPTFGLGILLSGFMAKLVGGNIAAGLVSGAATAFAWPLFFMLNLKVGRWLVTSPNSIPTPEGTPSVASEARLWGAAFSTGAILNAILFGLAIYFLLWLIYERIRPRALGYFRRHARERHSKLSRARRLCATSGADVS